MTKKCESTPLMISASYSPAMLRAFDVSILEEAVLILGPLKLLDSAELKSVHQELTSLLEKNIALVNKRTGQENDPEFMSLFLQWCLFLEIIKAKGSELLPGIAHIKERWHLLDTLLREE